MGQSQRQEANGAKVTQVISRALQTEHTAVMGRQSLQEEKSASRELNPYLLPCSSPSPRLALPGSF